MRWIIGDIHGMRTPLERLLEAVRRRDADARFYFTGDYCDRGPDSRGVVDLLLPLVADGRAVCCRGNHDDAFDMIVNRRAVSTDAGEDAVAARAALAAAFWNEGLPETLQSYDISTDDVAAMTLDEFADWVTSLPDRMPPSHSEFYAGLPLTADTGDFCVIHGAWPLDQADRFDAVTLAEASLRHELVWGRFTSRQVTSPKRWTRTLYAGHTPTFNYARDLDVPPDAVIRGERLVLIDTAAFTRTGWLTAFCHDTGEAVQVHHSGELL